MRGRKTKDEGYYGEISKLLFLKGKSLEETADCLNLNVRQIQSVLYNMNRKKKNLSKFACGAEEVRNYYKNSLKIGQKIVLKKRMLDDDEFDTVLMADIIKLYDHYFRLKYDENGRFECFLYSDLFTEAILIDLIVGGNACE